MNGLEQAAWEIHNFFSDQDIPYMVIGILAVQYWAEPRYTQDVDLTVSAPFAGLTEFIGQILDYFSPRLENALEFARLNRVVLVKSSNGYPLDIALGLPRYEGEAIRRAVDINLAPGTAIRVCSAEDLIIQKTIAGRAQDIRDIEGIVYRQGAALDSAYIRQWLLEFMELLVRPEISDLFEAPWRKIQE